MFSYFENKRRKDIALYLQRKQPKLKMRFFVRARFTFQSPNEDLKDLSETVKNHSVKH